MNRESLADLKNDGWRFSYHSVYGEQPYIGAYHKDGSFTVCEFTMPSDCSQELIDDIGNKIVNALNSKPPKDIGGRWPDTFGTCVDCETQTNMRCVYCGDHVCDECFRYHRIENHNGEEMPEQCE